MKKLKIFLSVIVMLITSAGVAYAVVQSLNGQSGQNQTFSNDPNVTINSASNVHSLGWSGLLPVSRGGTGKGSFTGGSVLFASTASISEDNSNLFWNDINNRLGIGTNTPSSPLDVNGTVEATTVSTNSVVASGSNQSISLNPTGTGRVLVGGESLVVARLTSQPASPSTGQIYFDRSSGKFKGYNGSYWITFAEVTPASVSALVIAGGGGGGTNAGGGGGAGGYQEVFGVPISVQSYAVTVGTGGAADTNGGNSSAFGYTSDGGGAGADFSTNGNNGGSGGGASGGFTGGTGSQGSNGGGNGSSGGTGHGGGGAGEVGQTITGDVGGNGGSGTSSLITGSAVTRAGGGGGGGNGSESGGSGGAGGGGAGGSGPGPSNGTAGTTNSGSGGGGGSGNNGNGGSGGSGVVIIRYLDSIIDATGGSETTDGAYRIHTFNSSGTFTVTSIQ